MSETKRRGRKRGHGEGTIDQRADGRWRGRLMVGYRPDGKADRRVVYGKTRAECQQKLDELRRRASGGTLSDPERERETVATYLERWLTIAKSKVRGKTHKRYGEIARLHLIPQLGRHRLAALRPDHVQAFYEAKLAACGTPLASARRSPRAASTQPLYACPLHPKARSATAGVCPFVLSPRTVHHCHAVLHRALEQAVRWGAIARNVCDAVDPPSVPRRELKPPMPTDLERLIDTAEAGADRLAALWTAAVYSGCRQGELLALQWGDIDLDAATLTIRRNLVSARGGVPVYGEPKTDSSRRMVSLPPEAVAALRAHRDRQNFERQRLEDGWADYDLVFTSVIGTPLDQRNAIRLFKAALKRAGLAETIRFHDLRHAAATLMLAAGVDHKTASARLGHSTIRITMDLYTHAVQELDAEAAQRMQRMLRRSAGT